MKNILITMLFVFWMLPLHATIVNNGTYTTINGLDWLDLTQTDGMSINEALISFPGWSLATIPQYLTMIESFVFQSPDSFLGVSDPVDWSIWTDDIEYQYQYIGHPPIVYSV